MPNLPNNVFRANAGAMIINSRGEVLALERSDIPGVWRMPQGGLKVDESPVDAVFREIKEESGISKDKLEPIAEYLEWLVYELEDTPWAGRGKAQKWFVFRFIGDDKDINLEQDEEHESTAWQWMKLQDIIQHGNITFLKDTYAKLFEKFKKYLS